MGRRGIMAGACSRRRAEGGFSLLELTMVLGVFTTAFLALSQSLGTSMRLTHTNRETRLANDAAREMVEILQGVEDFDTIFRLYNDDAGDDGGLFAPGSGFAVDGLTALDGDPDGFVGEIVFPTAGGQLREDVQDDSLGMPRDLNGDGDVDDLPHSGDYRLLPVALRLQWTGPDGERHLEVRTLLADR